MKLYVALCDDEIDTLNKEKNIIEAILKEKGIEYKIDTFSSPKDMLHVGGTYDIVFLDIEMNDMKGIDLAKQIKERKRECFVFFITNYSVYLDQAFDINALRYLTKPVDKDRLASGIDRAVELLEAKMKKIRVRNLKNKIETEIYISEIIYISNTGRHAHIVSEDHEFDVEEIFSTVQNSIEKEVNYFAMPHQSYYVNLKRVSYYDKKKVVMSYAGKTYEAFMTRRRYKEFEEKIFKMARELK